MIKFSIITVCRNEIKNIEKCIESVNDQTYKSIEHIVIDGESTDGTADFLKSISKRFHYFESSSDNGIYDAMNKAITHATGDVLYFLNASDYFYDEHVLEKISNIFKQTPQVDVIHGKLAYTKNGKDIYFEDEEKFHLKNTNDFFKNNPAQQCFFIKRNLFLELGNFNEKYKIGADFDWIISAFKRKYLFFYAPITLTVFDMNGISATSTKKRLREKKMLIFKHASAKELAIYIFTGLKQVLFRKA